MKMPQILDKLCLIIFINLFDSISSLNIEELKSLNYEVDISQIPVKKSEDQTHAVYMTSKYGQSYQCILPKTEDDDDVHEKEKANEKNTDIQEILKPLNSGNCLIKSKDWWTYELCFGRYVKQFHIEEGRIMGPVITLGLFDSDFDWNNETDQEKFKNMKQRYHSQYYVNGTKCDLTGQPRNAEVRMFCDENAGDYIYRVDEPGTCSYVITIYTSRLCSHPLLKPFPSKKSHSIPCHPVLNEDQYAMYMQKSNEEKEQANLKSSQQLNNQQDHLQILKKESLDGLEAEDIATLKKNNEGDESEESDVIGQEDDVEKNLLVDDIDHISYLKKLVANKRRKNLEKAVKEKLEKAGIEGGRIEVKIIEAGYFDNDGKNFHSLTDVESDQFQNMIMSLLTGQREAVQEAERHKKLEENYKFSWESNNDKERK